MTNIASNSGYDTNSDSEYESKPYSKPNDLIMIIGPMFSGKTTKLIEMYNEKCSTFEKDKCLAINFALDKRYGEGKIVSHDKLEIDCHCLLDLGELIDNYEEQPTFMKAEYIFINEAQFFPNLLSHVRFMVEALNKNVILCGLDLDFKKQQFGELLDLSVYATKIYKLTGKCNTQNCLNPSQYSHRIVKNDKLVLIGSSEYIPLCENCYKEQNDQSNIIYSESNY